ncbi:hypothetical protein [Microbacterium maritypicum]
MTGEGRARGDLRVDAVRTAEHPMAFTRDDLWRGGLTTWALFAGLLPVCIGVNMLVYIRGSVVPISDTALQFLFLLFVVTLFAALIALLLVPLGVLLAWPVGLALRGVRSQAVHLVAFALLGTAVAAVYLAFAGAFSGLTAFGPGELFLVTPAIAVAVATPLGWWITARNAVRRDARSVPDQPRSCNGNSIAPVSPD